MTPQQPLVDRSLEAELSRSDYLSAARIVDDLERAQPLLQEAHELGAQLLPGVDRVVLVGAGGSFASLLTADYLLDGRTTLPVRVLTANDLTWRQPAGLDAKTLFVLTSYSGRTADVLGAFPTIAASGGQTLALTGNADSDLTRSCDHALVYAGTAIYELPVLLLLAFFGGDTRGVGAAELDEVARAKLPGALRAALPAAVDTTARLAEETAHLEHLYVTGGGPLTSLAFKLAPVLMENMRIGATYYDVSEMRHGPLEVLHDQQPTLLALLGTDESRPIAAGVVNFWRAHGGLVVVIDAADQPTMHPLLTPILLNPITQWFVAWSAAARGITDLDERVYMGKGLFSSGRWP